MARIEELLPLVTDVMPATDYHVIEMDLLSRLVADYEEEHFPITLHAPSEAIAY